MTDDDRKEGRFSRWSKRKLKANETEQETIDIDSDEEAVLVDAEQIDEAKREREALLLANREAAEAVDLDKLNKDSDLSVFIKEGVPELLKKKAMQMMWRSSPVFANIDGLCDYDDDFGSPDLNMKVFKSAYQAGRGYLELAKEKIDEIDEMAEKLPDITSNEDVVEASEETLEDVAEAENLSDETAEDLTEEELSAESEVDTDMGVEVAEPQMAKISLRQRLALD